MRRCRLDIGGKIQVGIIDNLKPLLYQIPRKIREKTTNKNNCIHEYLINSLLLQAQDLLPGVWSYRSLLDNLSDLATRWEHNARGLRQTISRELDGHVTISSIFGIEQFPVVD